DRPGAVRPYTRPAAADLDDAGDRRLHALFGIGRARAGHRRAPLGRPAVDTAGHARLAGAAGAQSGGVGDCCAGLFVPLEPPGCSAKGCTTMPAPAPSATSPGASGADPTGAPTAAGSTGQTATGDAVVELRGVWKVYTQRQRSGTLGDLVRSLVRPTIRRVE